jgi:hypothetical protein
MAIPDHDQRSGTDVGHTIGIERLTKATIAAAYADVNIGTLAVVERYDGCLVKVCATSADVRKSRKSLRRNGANTITAALMMIGEGRARAYGAIWVGLSA